MIKIRPCITKIWSKIGGAAREYIIERSNRGLPEILGSSWLRRPIIPRFYDEIYDQIVDDRALVRREILS